MNNSIKQEARREWGTIGSSDFEEFVTQGGLFVDKTKLIQVFVEEFTKCTLITRPRRWGKSLNMSMLQYFFTPSIKKDGSLDEEKQCFKKEIFSTLKIGAFPEIIEQYLGQYPTILISFQDVKATTYQELEEKVRNLIYQLYTSHNYLLHSQALDKYQKLQFEKFLTKTCDRAELEASLQTLSHMLHAHFGKKAIILIDEYDTPLNDWYASQLEHNEESKENRDFAKDALNLFRGLLGGALKGNNSLEKGVMTGILRLAKANLFSGLNNLREYNILNGKLAEYFGFTETEVHRLLDDERVDIPHKFLLIKGVKDWYNGYHIGGFTLYNPWSIMNCLANKGDLMAYWMNTGDDSLIKNALGLDKYQQELQTLVSGGLLRIDVNPFMVFEDIKKSPQALWNLLLFAGYLTVEKTEESDIEGLCDYWVRIPNKEVREVYSSSLIRWFSHQLGLDDNAYKAFISTLLEGKVREFAEKLQSYLQTSMSYHQTGEKEAEGFYSGFACGLIAGVSGSYHVEHERESGEGRIDLLLIPKAEGRRNIAFIIEIKVAKKNEDLPLAAQKALQQIQQKNYEAKIKAYPHVKKTIFLGLAFCGKKVHLVSSP